jgi:RNase H-fold protein (predicted Holliday junction resolvase)
MSLTKELCCEKNNINISLHDERIETEQAKKISKIQISKNKTSVNEYKMYSSVPFDKDICGDDYEIV